jgi:hypothetical protein
MWAASRISSTTTPRWTIHGRRRCSVQELARRMVDPPGTLRVLMHSLAFCIAALCPSGHLFAHWQYAAFRRRREHRRMNG